MAGRVLDVLALPDRGAALGAVGAARVAGRFGVDEMLAGLDTAYREALAAKQVPVP
jgi:hypothetical protein